MWFKYQNLLIILWLCIEYLTEQLDHCFFRGFWSQKRMLKKSAKETKRKLVQRSPTKRFKSFSPGIELFLRSGKPIWKEFKEKSIQSAIWERSIYPLGWFGDNVGESLWSHLTTCQIRMVRDSHKLQQWTLPTTNLETNGETNEKLCFPAHMTQHVATYGDRRLSIWWMTICHFHTTDPKAPNVNGEAMWVPFNHFGWHPERRSDHVDNFSLGNIRT